MCGCIPLSNNNDIIMMCLLHSALTQAHKMYQLSDPSFFVKSYMKPVILFFQRKS